MKLFLRSILFFAIASFAPDAHGQDTIWSNAGGGTSFETPSNWNNGIPAAGLTAFVVPNGVADPTGLFLVTPGGLTDIVVDASTSHVSDGLFITNDIADNLTVGTVTMTFAPATTYTINGDVGVRDGETLNYSGNLTVSGSVEIGYAGNGTMTFTAGTLDNSSGDLTIGETTGDTGSFTQSGLTPSNSTVLTSHLSLGIGGGTGTYMLSSTGINNLTLSAGGFVDIGNGTFTQNDSASTVDLSGGTIIEMGLTTGDVAIYNLQAGTLKMTDTILGVVSGSTATINQLGGTLTSSGTFFEIGANGTGNYNLSGGSADFQNGFTVGDSVGSAVTQSGVTTLTAEGVVTIGSVGIGTYNLQGGTATFNAGVVVGATGTVNQTGGTFIIPLGQTLNLSAVGSSYSLGGTLELPSTGLIGTTGQGTLSFAGSTLQITSAGGFTDSLNGTVSGQNILDTTNANITLSGALSDGVPGQGAFDIIGGGTASFTTANNSAATWGINIENGTVDATAALFPSSGAITIGSGGAGATGTLTLAMSGNVTLTGNVTSAGSAMTGALNVNFAANTDTLKLTGATHFTGTTTLSGAGTLEVSNGTLGNIQGALGKVMIGGPAASGTVNLAGTNSYTGLTTVNSGYTLFTNNLSGNLQNAGTFGSGLTPATLPAVQATTVALGGQFNSTGAILLNSNGTVTDLYTVMGTSALSGTVVLSGVGTTTNHVFINAPAGLTTAGLTLVVSGSGVLFNASIHEVGGTQEELTTSQNPTATFAQTPNERAVAGAIDPILTSPAALPVGFRSLGIALNNLTAAQIPGALEELTPESLQYARMISFENSTFLVERMNGVDADLRGGYGGLDTSAVSVVAPGFNSGLGRSLGSLLASDDPAYHPSAPNGVNYYPGGGGGEEESTPSSSSSSPQTWSSSSQVISDSTPPNPYMATQTPSGPETPALSEFIGGDAVLADLNKSQSAANAPSSKASYTAGDAAAGISYRMTSHLAMGVLFDYNHTDAKTDSSGSKTKVDSYSPGLFATYFDHGFYVNGLFSFGYNNYSNTRDISFLGETASSHPSGQQYVGDLDFGYDFHPNKNWVIGPTVGATYTHLNIDSFTETGAPEADLSVNSQSVDSLRSRLGGHVIFQTNTGDVLLQPNLTAMWQHEYLDNGSGITSSFSDFSSSPFTIQTASPSRDSALVGIGMTATLSNSLALYLNYMADVGASDYFAQSVVGGLKARF